MSRARKPRIWCPDPDLSPHRAALAAALKARILAGATPPARLDGVVVGAGAPAAGPAREIARARGVPLTLAAGAPLEGDGLHAFSGATLLLCLPIAPEHLRAGASLEAAARGAFAEGGGRSPVDWLPDAGDPMRAAVARALIDLVGPDGADAALPSAFARAVVHPSPYDADTALPAGLASLGLAAMRRHAALAARPAVCFGAKSWNRAAIRAAFSTPERPLDFAADAEAAIAAARRTGGRVLGWAAAVDGDAVRRATEAKVELWRIEDGFLRSVGLGAGLAPGAALAFDDEGIYFDASGPSRMETLLRGRRLSEVERARARLLIARVRAARVTKYNVGGGKDLPELPADREIVLVPGQVGDDAGVRRSRSALIDCAGTENVNLDLLRLARTRNPDAHILYKPHPDVEAGLRKGGIDARALEGLADRVVTGHDILDLLEIVDRVETFSSLSGFEALLRGVPVTVHGMPFYAGWGLTRDTTPNLARGEERETPLDLETLAHVAFVDYPVTIDPVSLHPCPPEFLIDRLVARRGSQRHRMLQRLRQELSWLGRKLGL